VAAFERQYRLATHDLVSRSFHRVGAADTSHRLSAAEAVRLKQEQAAWQQRLALLISRHRRDAGLASALRENFWMPLAQLGEESVGSTEVSEMNRRGIVRLVTAVRLLEELGYAGYSTSGHEDVLEGIDVIAAKEAPNWPRRLFLAVQVKPTEYERAAGMIELATATTHPGELSGNLYQAARWARARSATARQHGGEVAAALVSLPPEEASAGTVEPSTGLLVRSPDGRYGFLDTLPRDCLDTVRRFEASLAQPAPPAAPPRHTRRIYDYGR
jgi:hypothetical protein